MNDIHDRPHDIQHRTGTPLTMEQKERILRNVSLGVPPPHDESPEARDWRLKMEHQVGENRELGIMNEIPWNP